MTLYYENETDDEFEFGVQELVGNLIRTICEVYELSLIHI